jgi:hypothetical protein
MEADAALDVFVRVGRRPRGCRTTKPAMLRATRLGAVPVNDGER